MQELQNSISVYADELWNRQVSSNGKKYSFCLGRSFNTMIKETAKFKRTTILEEDTSRLNVSGLKIDVHER